MDFQKWFHRGVAPALSVCVTLLFNTPRRLYIHRGYTLCTQYNPIAEAVIRAFYFVPFWTEQGLTTRGLSLRLIG